MVVVPDAQVKRFTVKLHRRLVDTFRRKWLLGTSGVPTELEDWGPYDVARVFSSQTGCDFRSAYRYFWRIDQEMFWQAELGRQLTLQDRRTLVAEAMPSLP
jgi:hypothetical protein